MWKCPYCNYENNHRHCANCGAKMPDEFAVSEQSYNDNPSEDLNYGNNQGNYSQGNQSNYSQGNQSNYSQGNQANYSQGNQANHSQGNQANYSQGNHTNYSQGNQANYSQGNQTYYQPDSDYNTTEFHKSHAGETLTLKKEVKKKKKMSFGKIVLILVLIFVAYAAVRGTIEYIKDKNEAERRADMLNPSANEEGLYGYINGDYEVIIDYQFSEAYEFSSNGLARVEINDKYGYINKKGEVVIDATWDWAYDFAPNGLALVYDDTVHKYGFINSDGVVVIDCIYDEALSFGSDGYAEVTLDGETFYIDENGEKVEK